jgi:hypothetical protein
MFIFYHDFARRLANTSSIGTLTNNEIIARMLFAPPTATPTPPTCCCLRMREAHSGFLATLAQGRSPAWARG